MFDKKHAPQIAVMGIFVAILVAALAVCFAFAGSVGIKISVLVVTSIAYLVFVVSIFMFLIFNDGLFFSSTAMTGIFCTALAVLPVFGKYSSVPLLRVTFMPTSLVVPMAVSIVAPVTTTVPLA